ncbi:hypothetical protein MCEMSEM29_00440 [Methylophilaceae bacterium]
MATLKIKFKLNPGREGIPLGKLSKQTENIELFLRSLIADFGFSDSAGLWLASNFKNGSVISTAEYPLIVGSDVVFEFNNGLYDLINLSIQKTADLPHQLSYKTIERFSKLREQLDADEKIGIGIFDAETSKVDWNYVNRKDLEEMAQAIDTELTYSGSIMGYTYEWNKGAVPPYIYIRELVTDDLVKCIYKDDDYDNVSKLFQKRDSLVTVTGIIKLNRITEKHELTMANQFETAPDFSDNDYQKFFGCDPSITGDLTAAEFIAKRRQDDN